MSGTLFTNFLATGHRSVIAGPSVLASIPGFYSTSAAGKRNSFIESPSEVNSFIGLGNILTKQGYTTSFHHGARRGALGLDAYSRLAGFSHYFGKEDYLAADGSTQDTVWGVWDEEFFLDAVKRMDGFKSPFCSVIFSLTSHEPFRVPPHREALFAPYSGEGKFQQVLRYTDYSLQQFFQAAEKTPWFKDTIFIITADHGSHSQANNYYSSFHIPLLIYAPGVVKPGRFNQIGSQVDILPTVLDLLQISTVHSSMGCSLLETSQPHYAVVSDGIHYSIFADQFVLLNDLEKNVGLYDYQRDPFFKEDLQLKEPDVAERLKRYLYAYIQSVSDVIARNRICRAQDLR
jgi:phosphoglycerol transferase MdoB-like AlkP superfamily enzyme